MRRSPSHFFGWFLLLLLASSTTVAEAPPFQDTDSGPLTPIKDERLHNLFQYSSHLYSGAEPADPKAFEALSELGIKTLISVDGATPKLELAEKRGMRYIHLPMPYHSIHEKQKQALAKALLEMPKPIYIHCHHGIHRGPAAAALSMVGLGLWDKETALQALRQSGTSKQYTELYASVGEEQTFEKETLRTAKIAFPKLAKLPAFTEAMVIVQSHLDRLALTHKHNFRPPENHPDISPPHEALQLREALHEIGRMPEVKQQEAQFRAMMKGAERAVHLLEEELRQWADTPKQSQPSQPLTRAWNAVGQSCTGCHRVYRVKKVQGLDFETTKPLTQ